jgi:glycosyltransferase involved in cell wall biosynthesis
MKILIVTPARNEAKNLPLLFESIKNQVWLPHITWVIVDDGSSDETVKISQGMNSEFNIFVLRREKKGSLISGAAYAAWWHGIDYGIALDTKFTHIMKLDADVSLGHDYFQELFSGENAQEVDLVGGVISGYSREQSSYIPGPVKLYSSRAIELLRQLPVATGFDVMDEVLCRQNGMVIKVVKSAKFSMNRKIGHSQGLLHGRFRNGLVCKWVGYAPEYFTLHCFRYLFRRPFLFGSLFMFYGFVAADKGPYPSQLRSAHRALQRSRLMRIVRHPITGVMELYF